MASGLHGRAKAVVALPRSPAGRQAGRPAGRQAGGREQEVTGSAVQDEASHHAAPPASSPRQPAPW